MTSDEAKGKHGLCPTVTIQVGEGPVVINECDFDAAVHHRWDGATASAPAPEPVLTSEPSGDEVDSDTSNEAADAVSTKAGKKKR